TCHTVHRRKVSPDRFSQRSGCRLYPRCCSLCKMRWSRRRHRPDKPYTRCLFSHLVFSWEIALLENIQNYTSKLDLTTHEKSQTIEYQLFAGFASISGSSRGSVDKKIAEK